MTQLNDLQFYATPEHSCSYIDGIKSKTLFIDPKIIIKQSVYTQLSELGFRRSGAHIYRPHCDSCQACVSIRVPASSFAMSSSQRRISNKNSDLCVKYVDAQYSDEYYILYEKYINIRHLDGDMYPPSTDQFRSFLVESEQHNCFIEFRLPDNTLIALAAMDHLDSAMSAVYTFFDPSYSRRSLGTFAILWQIEEIRRRNMDFLYLGYWVDNCRKMNYKTNFRPMELLINGKWLKAT